MKRKINILFWALLMLVLPACEEYLDEPTPTDQLTSAAIFSSRDGAEAYISGIYRRFRGQHTNTHLGGLYSIYFTRCVKTNDLIQAPTWFLWDYAHTYRTPTSTRVNATWEYLYELVYHANSAIEGVEKSSLGASDKAEFIAHAKGLRAFFYFQLALEYQSGYAANPSAPAPPLYTTPTTEPAGMSTLQQMYDLIISDINAAVAGLPESRLGKSYMNKSVANGIKARVLMAMDKDWAQVEEAARAAYGGNPSAVLNSSVYSSGFDDLNDNDEWMWGLDQQADQTNYYYAAPHAFIDHYANGYFGTFINTSFVDKFSNTDVRNTFANAYGVPDSDYRSRVTSKFSFSFESDIPMMRTAEMILVEAEAKQRQGKSADAHNLLFALQSNRDPQAVKSSNSGDALLEEILLERRKELYAELGVEWFDAKRLQRGVTRDGNHRVPISLAPNDNRFFLTIPQNEIDANPNIDASVNDGR